MQQLKLKLEDDNKEEKLCSSEGHKLHRIITKKISFLKSLQIVSNHVFTFVSLVTFLKHLDQTNYIVSNLIRRPYPQLLFLFPRWSCHYCEKFWVRFHHHKRVELAVLDILILVTTACDRFLIFQGKDDFLRDWMNFGDKNQPHEEWFPFYCNYLSKWMMRCQVFYDYQIIYWFLTY